MRKLPSPIFEKSRSGKVGYSFKEIDYAAMGIEPALKQDQIRNGLPEYFPQLSEVEITRHYTALAHLNYSVDEGFYPLGSCTMKYNPKINEKIASMPELDAHPYAPHDLVQGNLEIIKDLEEWLIRITGFAAVTMTPAAGAHGEFTGMLVIRKYLESKGDPRKVVLIPDSAHGTNPASAVFAGYTTRQIPSNSEGIIDLETLEAHLTPDVAALMMTNPNTLGIFEKNIGAIADRLHKNGSLLYMDGANLNALLGIIRPGDLGVDVLHINLHKTFSTPHGGGGPGSGPVGVASHLAPFLPVPSLRREGDSIRVEYQRNESIGRIKNYYGQFLVIVKALAYLQSLGRDYLRRVTEDAVLNANYIRKRLAPHLDLPYSSPTLHEVVFSDKGLNVKTLDIAKRLLDYGFHPFTVYFPLIVHGAMMIEPTETESKETLDFFVETMIKILKEAETQPELLQNAPTATPVRRLDETQAARKLVLKWQQEESH